MRINVTPAHHREKPADRFARWRFNAQPAHWLSGGEMRFIASDYSHCRVWIKNTWLTRGPAGTIFGGNLYAGVDAAPAMLLKKRLGHQRVVLWDTHGEIHHLKKAAQPLLIADIHLPGDAFEKALATLERGESAEIKFEFYLCCAQGIPYVRIVKTIHMEHRKRSMALKPDDLPG